LNFWWDGLDFIRVDSDFGESRWSLGRRPSSSERRRRERTLTLCYDQDCQRAAHSSFNSINRLQNASTYAFALGMYRVRSSPACRTERMRSPKQPGPQGNAQNRWHKPKRIKDFELRLVRQLFL